MPIPKKGKNLLVEQLRTAIRESGLSVKQVAERAEIPQPVLSRFVSGDRDNLTLETTWKLCRLFGMKLTPPQTIAGH